MAKPHRPDLEVKRIEADIEHLKAQRERVRDETVARLKDIEAEVNRLENGGLAALKKKREEFHQDREATKAELEGWESEYQDLWSQVDQARDRRTVQALGKEIQAADEEKADLVRRLGNLTEAVQTLDEKIQWATETIERRLDRATDLIAYENSILDSLQKQIDILERRLPARQREPIYIQKQRYQESLKLAKEYNRQKEEEERPEREAAEEARQQIQKRTEEVLAELEAANQARERGRYTFQYLKRHPEMMRPEGLEDRRAWAAARDLVDQVDEGDASALGPLGIWVMKFPAVLQAAVLEDVTLNHVSPPRKNRR